MNDTTPPPQTQARQPGREALMEPRPESEPRHAPATGRLEGRTALITGGDSGIGRAVAAAFAREGADVAISHLEEHTTKGAIVSFTRALATGPVERGIRVNAVVGG